ncbi:glycine zipper 2TM domain-containing protein [Ensifer sp. BR816]|uniref:glycine zipper 2TM domain-containing protein n=1 Tax=Rhizobium sp. (strain BR816) TaxID=1057002 RepID=UPI00036AA721|nr:glycine zipper 2TM domain-containing protein [Ensifer sp. BR816]
MSKPTVTLIIFGALALSGCQSAATSQGGRAGEFGCIAGTVGGAIVGGVVGATIGSGTGQLWAVGGGATLGSAAGNALTCYY